MGKRGASVHKRERELKKAEKALSKQRGREGGHAGTAGHGGPAVATSDDLRGYYGAPPDPPRKGS